MKTFETFYFTKLVKHLKPKASKKTETKIKQHNEKPSKMSITATSKASVNSSSQGLPIQLRILSNILNSVISWTILFDMMKTSNSLNFEI